MTKGKKNGKYEGNGGENYRENAGFCGKDPHENMYKKQMKSKQNENDF